MSEPLSVVVLTGAGISAESGLKTFRDNDGLWEGQRVENVATPEAFQRTPGLVHEFYNQRRAQLTSGQVNPNAAHLALAEFERKSEGEFTLITQNVDNLHQRAGSENILPMHGELLQSRCQFCGEVFDCKEGLSVQSVCSACDKIGGLRPHVVWFGELPIYMAKIERLLSRCDLFVSIGTSSVVYPAAGFRQIASGYDAKTMELNLVPSDTGTLFDDAIYGKATEVVPDYFDELLLATTV